MRHLWPCFTVYVFFISGVTMAIHSFQTDVRYARSNVYKLQVIKLVFMWSVLGILHSAFSVDRKFNSGVA